MLRNYREGWAWAQVFRRDKKLAPQRLPPSPARQRVLLDTSNAGRTAGLLQPPEEVDDLTYYINKEELSNQEHWLRPLS
jgi:hypothetical protein